MGAQIGFALGSAVGGYVDPQVLQGPTLGDIPIQTSQEGVFRPIVYGAPQPFPGNIIMTGPKVFSTRRERQSKGGPVIESEEVHQTYAIRICEGPAKVLEILRDGKLVYSRTGSRPLDADSLGFASKIVLYEGDETQLPDGTLEGLPAAHGGGVGNVPAHRGTAYMVVVSDNLTPLGGRIPNYEFRMASAAVVTSDCDEEGLLAWWPLDDAVPGGVAAEVIGGRDGVYSANVSIGPPLRAGSSASVHLSDINEYMLAAGIPPGDITAAVDACTFSVWASPTDINAGSVIKNIATFWQDEMFGYADWGLCLQDTDNMQPGGFWTKANTVPVHTVDPTVRSVNDNLFILCTWQRTDDPVVGAGDANLYVNGQWVATNTGVGPSGRAGTHVTVGGGTFPSSSGFIGYVSDVKFYNYALSAQEVLARYLSVEDYYELPDSPGSYVNKFNGSVAAGCFERATPDTVYLSDIELDIIDRVGLEASQLDVSEITAIEVTGFLVGKQMSASAALTPLATAYFHDLPEYDLQIHARRRGDASVVSLTDNDFVETGEDEDIRAQAIELPRKLNLYFSDPAANHAIVPVPAERTSINVKATGIAAVQVPLVLDRDEAKQKAEILLKVIYEESQGRLVRELPAFKHADLVASDPITYDNKRWRINALQQNEATIKIEAVRDRVSNYTSSATAGSVVNPSDPISSVSGPSVLAVLQLPSLRSADNVPGVYLAVQGLMTGWPGADIYLSVDGGVSEQLVTTIVDASVLGELASDTDADGADSSGLIEVQVYNGGELESITDAQILARQNGFALVTSGISEIGQFQVATLNSAGIYDLTEVLRGQLSTTAASHNEGDRFVLLDNVTFLPVDVSHVGKTLIFRAVTRGTAPANNDTVSIVYEPPTFFIFGGTVTP